MWDGVDRRMGPDWLTKLINLLNVISWLVFVVGLAIFHFARPEMNNIILQHHNIPVRDHWLVSLKYWMLFSLYASVGLSLCTLAINRLRMKRRSDNNRYNAVILILVVLAFVAITSTI